MYGTYCRLNVRISASNIAVIRAARRKIAKHHRRAPEKREARKQFYRSMLHYHAEARGIASAYRL